MKTFLITKSGAGFEVEIAETDLERLKEQLAKGDVIDSVDE